MSLQKRFKARYPKANFADFKTGDFFGKPNIFFHNKAGDSEAGYEETAVFDDDGKDFRSSIYFSKEMKRQLGLAPGFPLELTHNPNPKLEIPAVPFNSEAGDSGAGESQASEAATGALKEALVQQEIYVTPSEKFKIKFRDIFTDTVITHRSSHESRRWLAGPNFEYWPQTLNFAFFIATTGCGVSRRILFEDKMRDRKNDLTDSELKLPPQVRSFFWFHVYFTVRRILFELGGPQNSLPLPGDTAFSQTENKYDIPSFERICAEFGISPNSDFRFTRGDNHGLGSVFEYFTNSGYTKTPFKYPSKETKFEDEGGRASDGNLVPYIENTEARNQYEYFLCPVSHSLTSAGLSRINQSFMRIGVNSDLNIPVRRSALKHNLGSRAVKLPHSGVETRVVKSNSGAGAKHRTKDKQVVKSETSDREFGDRESGDSGAGVTKETSDSETGEAASEAKTVSTSHETNLNVLIIVAGGLAWFLFR